LHCRKKNHSKLECWLLGSFSRLPAKRGGGMTGKRFLIGASFPSGPNLVRVGTVECSTPRVPLPRSWSFPLRNITRKDMMATPSFICRADA
jgi:hypothetical protein